MTNEEIDFIRRNFEPRSEISDDEIRAVYEDCSALAFFRFRRSVDVLMAAVKQNTFLWRIEKFLSR